MAKCKLFSDINEDVLSSLREYSICHRYSNFYILIEPRANYSSFAFWSNYLGSDRIWVIRDPQDCISPDKECLLLLSLSVDDVDLLKKSIIQSRDPDNSYSICGWLFTSKSGEDIQQHLIKMLVIKYQNDVFQFRYYDRRVMGRLIHILNDSQLNNLLAVIESWQFINHYDRLTIIEHKSEKVIGENPIKLTRHQWNRLSKIELFNRTVSAYHSLFPHPLSVQKEQLLDEALEMSDRYRMKEPSDIVTLGQFILVYGRRLLVNPRIQKNIRDSIAHNIPLLELFVREGDEFWASIRTSEEQ